MNLNKIFQALHDKFEYTKVTNGDLRDFINSLTVKERRILRKLL